MHTRRVEYRGFQRDDGLWDIEGELHDTKPHAFEIDGEGMWAPHEAIHHMLIRVTLDDSMVIRDIAVAMDAHPHEPCPQTMVPMQRLIGETVGRGWRTTIERHLGGIQGCTHLRELLFNLATAAFQTRSASFAPTADGRPPMHLGQCLAWDFNGPVVEKVYPMFFRWQKPAKTSA
jgi:hypothetical protein